MNKPRPSAKDRLARIRALVAGAVKVEHVFADTAGMHLEAKGIDVAEPETLCTIPPSCPQDNRELLQRHVEIPAELIRMIDAMARLIAEQNAELTRLRQALEAKTGAPAKDYAAECAMKCAKPAFRRFLAERHDLPTPATDTAVATRVRSLLAVKSRAELNTDPQAASRWRDMVRDFDAWRRRG